MRIKSLIGLLPNGTDLGLCKGLASIGGPLIACALGCTKAMGMMIRQSLACLILLLRFCATEIEASAISKKTDQLANSLLDAECTNVFYKIETSWTGLISEVRND